MNKSWTSSVYISNPKIIKKNWSNFQIIYMYKKKKVLKAIKTEYKKFLKFFPLIKILVLLILPQ